MHILDEAEKHRLAPNGPRMISEHAAQKLRDLLLYLKANPIKSEIRDTCALPVPKGTLINALRLLIGSEKRAEQRQQMQQVGILLAQFQPKVSGTLKVGTATETLHDPLTVWITHVQNQATDDVEHDRWTTVLAERDRLETLFNISARAAERKLVPYRSDTCVVPISGPAAVQSSR